MAAKKGLIAEFKEFIATGDLMSVAVAFVMGAATVALINSFVKDIFMGVFGLFFECKDIIDANGKVTGRDCSGLTGKAWKSIGWGNFINQVITFIIIGFVVFMMVKAYKNLTGRQLAQDGPTDNDLLKEIRDSLKSR